jgi:hypothetical protein
MAAGFVAALLSSLGCGGGSGGGDNSGPVPPAMVCTEAGTAGINTVTMSCGGLIDSGTERVDIVIEGPASGTTSLRGMNFDVVYDATKLEFLPDANPVSPLFPDAFVLVALANGQQGRVVAAIQQPGNLSAVAVSTGEHQVLSFSFRRLGADTFDPTPLTFERAQGTGAVPAITFANGLSLGYQ